MKACIDCKHFDADLPVGMGGFVQGMGPPMRGQPPAVCKHPDAESRDVVYGKAFCMEERRGAKGCGKQGKLWEQK